MIDWSQVLANALWLSGAALALAVVSYASWAATVRRTRMRAVLREGAYQLALYGAGILFCLGLAATALAGLEALLWLGLGLGCVVQFISIWRKQRRMERT